MSGFDNPYVDPLRVAEEIGGECRFCDLPIPVYNEGGFLVAKYQILLTDGGAFVVCEDCFELAATHADRSNVREDCGVSTLRAVSS